jgi:hypothetical protein
MMERPIVATASRSQRSQVAGSIKSATYPSWYRAPSGHQPRCSTVTRHICCPLRVELRRSLNQFRSFNGWPRNCRNLSFEPAPTEQPIETALRSGASTPRRVPLQSSGSA